MWNYTCRYYIYNMCFAQEVKEGIRSCVLWLFSSVNVVFFTYPGMPVSQCVQILKRQCMVIKSVQVIYSEAVSATESLKY